jgi:hypothetical protein
VDDNDKEGKISDKQEEVDGFDKVFGGVVFQSQKVY